MNAKRFLALLLCFCLTLICTGCAGESNDVTPKATQSAVSEPTAGETTVQSTAVPAGASTAAPTDAATTA